MSTDAVFFDVDFTLIYPGPMFQGEGYRAFGARYGLDLDAGQFDNGLRAAAPLLDGPDVAYDEELYVAYTRRIIEGMGGRGPAVDACAREVYAEWAGNHHFELFDDVHDVFVALKARGVRAGLISNSHRSLTAFQAHFDLEGLVAAAVSSLDHGLLKPHPSIFQEALRLAGADAACSWMVGDSVRQDVEGALAVGMRAALLHRGGAAHPREEELTERGVPVLRSLGEILALL